jgi:hypothetical protein
MRPSQIRTEATTNRRLAIIVVACLAASISIFSPRLWLMDHYIAGSFQWDRAHTFLLQCEHPFRRDIEPAMLWRVLPPLICYALRLQGKTPLALPWLGILCATTYTAIIFRRKLNDWRFVTGGTLLFATTSAVLVPVGWLGMNDCWVWFGLLAVGFGRSKWALPIACLLCPWVDERFIVGFPLAWMVREIAMNQNFRLSSLWSAGWLLPYTVVRLWLAAQNAASNRATEQFLISQFHQIIIIGPFVPLGWWMGLRAGWIAVIYGIWTVPDQRRPWMIGAALITVMASVALAADLSRSIAILIPLVCVGCFNFVDNFSIAAPRAMFALGLANLLIPAAHLTYTKIDPISPLPIEIYRCLRSP